MNGFYDLWQEAVLTTASFFWKALWAFILGYVISSCIQVFVTRERMRRTMGKAGASSVALGTLFGFISSSCSFAALATSKALFKKGAGFIPAMAFMLASTNLVIELGMIIAVFLSWQFVLGEYLGGILLILCMWLLVSLTRPKKLLEQARQRLGEAGETASDIPDWKERVLSRKGWTMVARHYFMEWGMVWKDVTIGFTVAGIIAAFVPRAFFQALFVGTGQGAEPGFADTLLHAMVGPVAAFFTFIGSMGNIPLAALLYYNQVSFAGIMAFIFSDLVVLPVLRINAQYYGWKLALYITGVLYCSLVLSALALHWGFAAAGILPQAGEGGPAQAQSAFQVDSTLFLNGVFLLVTMVLAWLAFSQGRDGGHSGGEKGWVERVLTVLTGASLVWLAGGAALHVLR